MEAPETAKNRKVGDLIIRSEGENQYVLKHARRPYYWVCNKTAVIAAECLAAHESIDKAAVEFARRFDIGQDKALVYIKEFVTQLRSERTVGIPFKFKTPLRVAWRITNRCNLNCLHCYTDANSTKWQELNTDECLKLAASFADARVVDILVTGGEALHKPCILEVLEILDAQAATKSIFSNGVLIPKLGPKLLQFDIDWFISVDGHREAHDAIRGAGNFEKTTRAIELLREAGRKVTVAVVLTRFNVGEIERFADTYLQQGLSVQVSILVNTGRAPNHASEIGVTPEELAHALERLAVLSASRPGAISIQDEAGNPVETKGCAVDGSSHSKGWACNAGLSKIVIGPDGSVFPCSFAPKLWPLGNLHSDSLATTWLHPNRQEFIKTNIKDGPFCRAVGGTVGRGH